MMIGYTFIALRAINVFHMKKLLLSALLAASCNGVFAQHSVFMHIIENKMICNMEDELTYYLQANSYERQNENRYYHYYAEGGQAYYALVINENECYVTYRTDNSSDYNKIRNSITSTCTKELAGDRARSESYVCNTKRAQDVQIIFTGYSQKDKYYEILVYQNPERHELPYDQADRVVPEEKTVVAKKAKKPRKIAAKTGTKTETKTAAAPAAPKPAAATPTVKPNATPASAPATPKVAPPPAIKPAPGAVSPMKPAPPVKK